MKVQPAVAVTVAIVVATTLLSGPAIFGVDLTATETFDGSDLGDGRVTVGAVDLPDTVVVERGDFGAGTYYLRVPSATVELREIVGRPIVSYQVSVEELSFTRSNVPVLSPSDEGSYELTIEEAPFGENEVRNESYAGELSVTTRYDDTEHAVATRNLTIEVVE